jgi:RNA polymerase sigma-70 factor (ECF subfamily)
MVRSDADLITAARGGDRAAIDELLTRYEPSIYRFGLRMCGDEEAAREVLQETLLAAFRHLSGFRGDATLSTWLFQIARSFCIKERRGVRPTSSLDDSCSAELVDPAPAPDARTHAREIGEVLSRAIAKLAPEQREVLILRDVEGMSAEHAAEVVGIEVGALKSRLHRARMALRGELDGALGDEPSTVPCPELAHALSAYAGAEIDQATCVVIENHLETCARCAGACDALKRSVSLCRRLPGNEVPAPVRAAVRGAILAAIGALPAAGR